MNASDGDKAVPEPANRAVGIAYKAGDAAPVIVMKASGDGVVPLVDDARGAGVAVVRDKSLVDQLYRVPIDHPIGRELFPVMAALIAHVLTIDRRSKMEET